MKLMRSLVLVLLLGVTLVSVGCNTFKGMGRDVEKGGEKMQDVAEDAKPSKN